MFKTLLISVAATTLVASSSAQQKQVTSTERATNAQYAGTYSPNTGLVAPQGGVAKSGPVSLFNNNTLTNYYSVPGAGQEWIDEGTLPDRNKGSMDQINGISFTYCSAVVDPTQNSVSSTLRFYAESGYCTGPTLWPAADCAYSLAGLPGGDANGALQCWILSVDLMGGFECKINTDPATNLFGWSNTFDQADTGPWLASGGTGNTDSFVWYDAAAGNGNEFLGCFWFGGPPSNPFAGFAAEIFGAPQDVLNDCDCPTGADQTAVLGALTSAQVGMSFLADVTAANPAAASSTMFVADGSVPFTPLDLNPILGIDAWLCCDYPNRVFESNTAVGVTHSTAPIPASVLGGSFCVQAACRDAAGDIISMSNTLRVCVIP